MGLVSLFIARRRALSRRQFARGRSWSSGRWSGGVGVLVGDAAEYGAARDREVSLSRWRAPELADGAGADAPTFANLPGLLAKIWLRDPEKNTYGGMYLWADREAYERYIKGEVFNAIRADQNLKNVESRDFGVFGDLSSFTLPRLRAA